MITVKNPTDSRRFYIGVRSCNGKPEEDTYWGSSVHFKKWQKENGTHGLEKQVLACWPSREEANSHEMLLHDCFGIPVNVEFWNRAKSTSSGFSTSGTKASEETKKKLSVAHKGKVISDAQKQKLSASKIGHSVSEEARQKLRDFFTGKKRGPMSQEQKDIRSALLKGRKWYNNGVRLVLCKEGDQPEGFVLGDSIRQKAMVKGRKWYNNGTEEKYFFEGTQPDTFVLGRLKGNKNGI
jgi:hypothetical protein